MVQTGKPGCAQARLFPHSEIERYGTGRILQNQVQGSASPRGVVIIDGEVLRGADSEFVYAGWIRSDAAGQLQARIDVQAHAAHAQSAFGGVSQRYVIELTGSEDDDVSFTLVGRSDVPDTPEIVARAEQIAPLGLDPR